MTVATKGQLDRYSKRAGHNILATLPVGPPSTHVITGINHHEWTFL